MWDVFLERASPSTTAWHDSGARGARLTTDLAVNLHLRDAWLTGRVWVLCRSQSMSRQHQWIRYFEDMSDHFTNHQITHYQKVSQM